MDDKLYEAFIPYFESAHYDARECFHELARISLHPDAGEPGCDAQYPNALPLTTEGFVWGGNGRYGMRGLRVCRKHEWLIPVFLFRNHEDAGQYIYTLNRDPDRTREVLGRKGDDFIAIVVNEQGKVTRFIAGEAKWRGTWNQSATDAVMLGPKIADPAGGPRKVHNNKGVWFEINRALAVPLGLEQLHAILEECEPDKYAAVIASLDRILALRNPDPVERTDLILLAGGAAAQREAAASLIDWEGVPEEYTAGRDLQIVELIIEDGDELITEIYDRLWAKEGEDAQFDQERVELARAVQNDLAQERTLSVCRHGLSCAAYRLHGKSRSSVGPGMTSSTVLQQARNLIRAGKVLLTVEGGSPTEAAFAFRRAGELLEWLARAKDLSALKSLRLSSPLGATSLVDCPRWPLASCVRLFPTIAGHAYSQTSSRPTLTEYFVALGIFGILIGLSPCGGRTAILWGRHLRERRLVQHSRIGSVYWPCIAKLAARRFQDSICYRAPERCRAALVENNF